MGNKDNKKNNSDMKNNIDINIPVSELKEKIITKSGRQTTLIIKKDTREIVACNKLAADLEINPLPASKLAKQLALQHYPVLISSSRIEQ